MYLDNMVEIRQDVATLKVNIAETQRELQDLNKKIARAFINNFFIYNHLFYFIIYILFLTVHKKRNIHKNSSC